MSKKKKHTEKHTDKKPEMVDLDEMNIILKIPKDAVALEVTASIIIDGELKRAARTLTVSDIHALRQDFLDNVELGDDYDATFVLTDEGRRLLEERERAMAALDAWDEQDARCDRDACSRCYAEGGDA